MTQDELKRAAARAALDHVDPGTVIGVGTGTTSAYFIEGLPERRVAGAVASSRDTERRLAALGIPILTLDDTGGGLGLYVDGADQIDPLLRTLKGGGGALVREKVVASAADRFLCIADESKLVERFTRETLAVECLPMARAYVGRELDALGGRATERDGYLTDNGNVILDVAGLSLADPEALELTLEALPGVVGCGVFARRRADVALIAADSGIRVIEHDC